VWALALFLFAAAPSADEIVAHSVVANERDWKAAPTFSFTERDVDLKHGGKVGRTYEVEMIEGSPYNKLVAVNDKPLSPQQQKAEEEKREKAIAQRKSESPAERAKRVHQYERERAQDHVLMREMARAFTFKLVGEETVAGRPAYVLDAQPKPGYKPINRDAKILTGMKGRLWVDKAEFHWAKVEAQVIRPVSFAYAFAKVGPGTRIVLEEKPASGGIWQPSHFHLDVASSIVGVVHRNSNHDETYTNYRRSEAVVSSTRSPGSPSRGHR
jgi:hypothetical protein